MAEDAETGDVGGEGTESPSESSAADATGAEAGSTPEPSDEPDPPASPADDPQASDADEPEEFKNALTKHKGDKAAFGRHYWQTQQDNARIAKERDEVKARLAELEAGQPRREKAPEPEPDLAPELQELESELGSLEEEKKALPGVQSARLDRVAKLHEEVIRLTTRLEYADELDKPIWEQKVRLAELHEQDARRSYAESRERERAIASEIKRMARDRDGLRRHFDSERERQEQVDRDREAFNKDFPARIDSLIDRTADTLNVTKDKAFRKAMWEAVNESLTVQFWRLKDVPFAQVDVEGLVKRSVQTYLQRHEMVGRTKFAQTSGAKLQVAKPNGQRPAPAPAPPKRPPLPYEIDDTDAKLKAARERAAAKGWG